MKTLQTVTIHLRSLKRTVAYLNLSVHSLKLWVRTKAGRPVGLADCYAVIVLADNATFLLAVNRKAAFRSHSAIITYVIRSSRGSAGRASAHQS